MAAGTGVPALDTVLVWGGAITILGGVAAVLWRAASGGIRMASRMDQFMDDWYGEESRPGMPARPGVLERVSAIEDRLIRVEHELYPNSGRSLRDAVDQANDRLIHLCRDECGPVPELPEEDTGPESP